MNKARIVMVPGERGMRIETPEDSVVTWTQDDEFLKHRLVSLLKDNIMEITFTKVDGTERTMKCTLKPTLLPESTKTNGAHKTPDYCLAVWDVEKNGWRSFRVHNVHDYITVRSDA